VTVTKDQMISAAKYVPLDPIGAVVKKEVKNSLFGK